MCSSYKNIFISALDLSSSATSSSDSKTHTGEDHKVYQHFNRTFSLPSRCVIEDVTFFYIGSESMTLTNWMLTFNKSTFFSYNPTNKSIRQETAKVNSILGKRYFLVEKAKDANIVGILVGTLGVVDYIQIIERMKQVIESAGKKYYVFSMGKLNVAKTANFSEIDIYVLVSCAESILLDMKDYYQKIVTPHEMELACNTDREWQGDYISEYKDLLPGKKND